MRKLDKRMNIFITERFPGKKYFEKVLEVAKKIKEQYPDRFLFRKGKGITKKVQTG